MIISCAFDNPRDEKKPINEAVYLILWKNLTKIYFLIVFFYSDKKTR